MAALFLIALLSFTVTIYYSFAGMRRFMSAALSYGDRQGRLLTRDSRAALLRQINSDLKNTAADQARIIGLVLENISGVISGMTSDVTAGRLSRGKGNPDAFHTGTKAPERPERLGLCHFAPGVPPSARTRESLTRLSVFVPSLFELNSSTMFIESSAIIFPDGVQIFHPWRKLKPDFDARKQPWYQEAIKAKGKIHWSKSADETVLICSQAVFSGSRLLAVIAAEIQVEPISSQVTIIRSGYLSFLTSSDGRVISGEKEFRQLSASTKELQQKIREQKSGVFQLNGENGPLLAASSPIPECGWNLVVCQPEKLAMKSIQDMEKMLADEQQTAQTAFEHRIYTSIPVYTGILISILILILVLGYFLAKQLTRPISTLMKNAHIIGSGHLNNKISLHTGDELEQLANTINQMADDLTRYIQNLNQAAGERQRVESELRTAAAIQSAMLPKPISGRQDIDICAVMRPAREVGGDLYDFVFIDPTHLFFAIGDVSGKGIPASLFMATAKTLMHGFARNALSPSEILQQTNNYLEEENKNCMFITVFCGLLDCVTGEMVCCNAGHNPPVYLKPDGSSSLLRLPSGFPLGPFHQESPAFYTEEHYQLKPGETLVLYTDGITEALNPQNEIFGSKRLEQALSTVPPDKNPLSKIMDSLLNILHEYTGNAKQSDDLTVLMIQYKGVQAK